MRYIMILIVGIMAMTGGAFADTSHPMYDRDSCLLSATSIGEVYWFHCATMWYFEETDELRYIGYDIEHGKLIHFVELDRGVEHYKVWYTRVSRWYDVDGWYTWL